MKKLNTKGFTLFELILVIAIVAILVAIAAPSISRYTSASTDISIEAEARSAYLAYQKALIDDKQRNLKDMELTSKVAGVDIIDQEPLKINNTENKAAVKLSRYIGNGSASDGYIYHLKRTNPNSTTIEQLVYVDRNKKYAIMILPFDEESQITIEYFKDQGWT